LFMFTKGRSSDWEKEKLFVFRSLYSNVEIDSVATNFFEVSCVLRL